MHERIAVTVYKVDNCGYYLNDGDARAAFGGLRSTMKNLRLWLLRGGKAVKDTATYTIDTDSRIHDAYAASCVPSVAGDHLLTLWIAVPTSDGGVGVIASNDRVGSAAVSEKSVPVGGIAGFAAYFWIIPQHNIIATIRIETPQTSVQELLAYMGGFLAQFSSRVVRAEPENVESPIVGFRRSSIGPISDMHPMFFASMARTPGRVDEIRARRSEIVKVLRKTTYRGEPDRLMLYQRILQSCGLTQPATPPPDIKVSGEVEYTPTEAEL